MGDIKTVDEVVEDLEGSCMCITDSIDVDDLGNPNKYPLSFFEELDSHILLCEVCGWWCRVGEGISTIDGEAICNDCLNEKEG